MAKNVSNENIENPYIPTKRKITYWFNILNQEIFNLQLTKFRNIYIKINLENKKGKCFAECESQYINKKPVVDLFITHEFKNIQHFLSILVHEMIHLWQWLTLGCMNHSKKEFFQPWSDKLLLHGITLSRYY